MSYSEQLKSLTTDAQLHLLFYKLSLRPRYVPVHTSNAVLIKWLKPQLKRQKYKLINKEIKTLIGIGRNAGSNLEDKVQELSLIEPPMFENENELFCAVCRSVERVLNVPVSLAASLDVIEANQGKGCFVLSENIAAHFDKTGSMNTPVSVIFRSVSKKQFAQVLEFFDSTFGVRVELAKGNIVALEVRSKT